MPTEVMQTATQVAIIDSKLSAWEYFAGEDINVFAEYKDDTTPLQPTYWGYRGQAAMCKRSTDEAIIRVRIGTPGDPTDRNVYRQIVTDPTVAAQWESWSLLYSGDFYTASVQRDENEAAGYVVYHGGEFGSWRDNANNLGGDGPPIKIRPVTNKPGAAWYATLVDNTTYPADIPQIHWYYMDTWGVFGAIPLSEHSFSYFMADGDLTSFLGSGLYNKILAIAYGQNPRDDTKSMALVLDSGPLTDLTGVETTRYMLTQASERAGKTFIKDLYYANQLDGTHDYLFFTKQQTNESGEILHNIDSPLYYCRSKLLTSGIITEPMPTGLSLWGFAGVVSSGDYLYAAGNGAVYRRLKTPVTTELSNYAISGTMTLNPDNQKSTAEVTLANPANAVGEIIGYTPTSNTDNTICRGIGSQLRIRLGQKLSNGTGYTYGEPGNWWISKVNRVSEDNKNRIIVSCEDFWNRLENPYTTDFYYPGKIESRDWVVEADNDALNYFVPDSQQLITTASGPSDSYPVKMKLTRTKFTLDTRWRLFDGSFQAHIEKNSDQLIRVVFRYLNSNNYHSIKITSSGTLTLNCKYHGKEISYSLYGGSSVPSTLTDFTIKVVFRGDFYQVWINDVFMGAHTDEPNQWELEQLDAEVYSIPRAGFVGLLVSRSDTASAAYTYDWQIENCEEPLLTSTILKKALGHAGFLDAEVTPLEDNEQVEILMGPQTDLPDPSKVLEKLQDSTALKTIWLPNLTASTIED